MTDKNNKHGDATTFAGAVTGSELASTEAAASDELRIGMERFLDASDSKVDARWLKGNLFEYIVAAKYSADAVRRGVDAKAVVTAAHGEPQAPSDINIVRRSDELLLDQAQLKTGSRDYQAWALSDPKFDDMRKVVPLGHAEGVRKTRSWPSKPNDPRNYRDTADRVEEALEYGGASSGGTSPRELKAATDHPKRYAIGREVRQIGRETVVTAVHAAAAGAVMGGAMSFIRNVAAYSKGDVDREQAAKNVATDTVESGVRSAGTAALGVGIRNLASRAGVKVLAKSNVATAVAAGLIEVGVTAYAYAKGEIPGGVAAERLGRTACSTTSGIGMGAAAGAIFGPVGSIVGGIAGYLLATQVYQSCVAVFNGAGLAREEAERVVALCRQAVEDMDRQRKQFDVNMAAYLGRRQAILDQSFAAIDHALVTNQSDDAVRALGDLLTTCGQRLRFDNFRDFDRFMTESDEPLVI